MASSYADQLLEAGLIAPEEHAALAAPRPFALGGELRALQFTGVSLFVSGAGVLAYDHIDTIGHAALLGALAVLCLLGYAYAFRQAGPLAWGTEPTPGLVASFALLLAALLLAVLVGYAQAVYQTFGTGVGWAALAVALLQGATAYRFGHAGVLSLALTALAAWLGLELAPAQLLSPDNLLSSHPPDYLRAALTLTLISYGAVWMERRDRLRPHFIRTYLYTAVLVGLVSFATAPYVEGAGLYALLFSAAPIVFFYEARRMYSPTILLAVILAVYVFVSRYVFLFIEGTDLWLLATLYLCASGVGCIWLVTRYRTLLKGPADDVAL